MVNRGHCGAHPPGEAGRALRARRAGLTLLGLLALLLLVFLSSLPSQIQPVASVEEAGERNVFLAMWAALTTAVLVLVTGLVLFLADRLDAKADRSEPNPDRLQGQSPVVLWTAGCDGRITCLNAPPPETAVLPCTLGCPEALCPLRLHCRDAATQRRAASGLGPPPRLSTFEFRCDDHLFHAVEANLSRGGGTPAGTIGLALDVSAPRRASRLL